MPQAWPGQRGGPARPVGDGQGRMGPDPAPPASTRAPLAPVDPAGSWEVQAEWHARSPERPLGGMAALLLVWTRAGALPAWGPPGPGGRSLAGSAAIASLVSSGPACLRREGRVPAPSRLYVDPGGSRGAAGGWSRVAALLAAALPPPLVPRPPRPLWRLGSRTRPTRRQGLSLLVLAGYGGRPPPSCWAALPALLGCCGWPWSSIPTPVRLPRV